MAREQTIRKYRAVVGQFNTRAVCSRCKRDASQTRMSFYCVDVVNNDVFTCDECRVGN